MENENLFHPPLPKRTGDHLAWNELHGASVALALSNAMANSTSPYLLIAPDPLSISHLLEALAFFKGDRKDLLFFPDWETLPYDHFSPHQDIISERLSALHRIPSLQQAIIITTVATLMHALPPRHYLDAHRFLLKTGDILHPDIFSTRLSSAGYRHVSQVREHGEFAIRGSIIDLFPMGSRSPYRIDLFDNEVDSIRLFSPETQRSLEKIAEINLLPAKEFPLTEEAIEHFRQAWRSQFSGDPLKCPIYRDVSDGISTAGIEYYLPLFFEKTASLFDYLPENTTIVTLGDLEQKANDFWQEVFMRYEQSRFDITRPLLPPSQLFMSVPQIKNALAPYTKIQINSERKKNSASFNTAAAPQLDINHKATQPLAALQEFLSSYDGRVLFCAESMGRREIILQSFKNISFTPTYFANWQAFLASQDQYGIVVAAIEEGFSLTTPKMTLLTETHLYGKRVMQRRLRKKSVQDPDALIRNLTELQIDDAVVHIDHGIGRYRGLEILKIADQIGEFLCLEYQGNDKLYVPVSSLHLISRYSGADLEHIPINKLGTEHWQRAKQKAAEKVRDVAAELLDLYAKRAARPGHAFEIPHDHYANFSAGFPFEETPDQLQTIEQVFADMRSDKPMDRVVCGDVGFGKTEIAIRAAFLAVQNNRQVVVLVPTTLLAQQHFENFRDRFADWPIQVEVLSRFRTAKEQNTVLQRLKEGKVDIVIGTHKLLQNDMQLKDLGLIIIDEEHRFGVKQKEKLKALRSMVDILTLTATPIPRTLNMALSGIRDLSVIATPPARRLSVKTFVHEYQNTLVQEAIQREIMRGGQVYFLHNEITSIHRKAEEIAALIPEARTAIAHGQMHERDLERVMSEFYHRHFNVLICSTIIESGIDIPTANTIIINRADKFGLAQLHQLRGRVGRSHHQAYAYLLIPSKEHITSDAEKRLTAITSLDELGIGFSLATHDLEIRGAGALLGEEQSGNMHEVGFTLYMDLLSRAVDALKEGREIDFEKSLSQDHIEIDLHITALIPDSYLNDVQLRLLFYKRIANTRTQTELDEIHIEMIDRFGLLPDPLKNLFAITEIKQKANALGISKIDANENGGKLEFNQKPNIKPETIIRLIQQANQQFRLDGPTRLRFKLAPHEKTNRIQLVTEIIQSISE